MHQALQQRTELTEVDKIILKDKLNRHMRAEEAALSFPPRTVGVALAVTIGFLATGNHLNTSSSTVLFFLLVGFLLYTWGLLKQYNLAKRELRDTSLRFGVQPVGEVSHAQDLTVLIVCFSLLMTIILGVLLTVFHKA